MVLNVKNPKNNNNRNCLFNLGPIYILILIIITSRNRRFSAANWRNSSKIEKKERENKLRKIKKVEQTIQLKEPQNHSASYLS